MVNMVVVLGCWLDLMILRVFSNFKDSMIKDILELEILTHVIVASVVLIYSQSLVLFFEVRMPSAAFNLNFSPHLNSLCACSGTSCWRTVMLLFFIKSTYLKKID